MSIIATLPLYSYCAENENDVGGTIEGLEKKLETGKKIWEQTVQTQNNYYYIRTFRSWVGFQKGTLVEITNGVLTGRYYRYKQDETSEWETWEESSSNGNLNAHAEGYPGYTMEEIYDVCAQNILDLSPDANEIGVVYSSKGALTTCYYRPHNCADDCTFSFGAGQFQFGEVTPATIADFYEDSI